jgi:hypothetical protein
VDLNEVCEPPVQVPRFAANGVADARARRLACSPDRYEVLLRLAPSSPEEPVDAEGRRTARPVEVPLAESSIRE